MNLQTGPGAGPTTVQPAAAEHDQIHPLDRPSWLSLTGAHAALALGAGKARRYRPEFSPFAAVADPADPQSWHDLAELYGPDEVAVVAGASGVADPPPPGWTVENRIPGVQLIATAAHQTHPDPEAFAVGDDDAAEALDLVTRTEPGPFRARTHQLGSYLGIRRDGALVALAGERLHPPGWTEISAVCTDPSHRRQGLAGRLVAAVSDGIRARGETPFLHTGAANTRAIDLYLELGFVLRREVDFLALRRNDSL